MTDILRHLQSYVPCKTMETVLDMEPFSQTDYQVLPTLVGGDQLSVARARGCILIQNNCENRYDRLSGLLPVIEDWHAKVCFMQVKIDTVTCMYEYIRSCIITITGDMQTIIQNILKHGTGNLVPVEEHPQ